MGKINISKEIENIILNKIKNIKIENKKDYFLIELESKIFYEERFKRLKILPHILSETNINNHKKTYRNCSEKIENSEDNWIENKKIF